MNENTMNTYINAIVDRLAFNGHDEFTGEYDDILTEIDDRFGYEQADAIEAAAMARVEKLTSNVRNRVVSGRRVAVVSL